MKVLNLRCSRLHSFEGWFGSEQDFQDQLRRDLILCPMCADNHVQKMPSAPRLNFGAQPAPSSSRPECAPSPVAALPDAFPSSKDALCSSPIDRTAMTESGQAAAAQAVLLAALRQVVATTEDMGQRFSEEARRMHYGEIKARAIRGQASVRETVELLEEGIAVMPLPMLPALKETLQ